MEHITLLTGATGFLGRYLLRDLLADGQRVIVLARSQSGIATRARVNDALRWAGGETVLHGDRLEICEGDLTDVASLESAETRRAFASCTTIIHSAGDTGFKLRRDGEPWTTNFNGTKHLFDHVGAQCNHWVQISTAYTSPVQSGIGIEATSAPSEYRNAYEESKHAADCYLQERASSRGMRLVIARPGVVVGEYASGKTSSYDGFYGPMQMLATLVRRADRRSDGSVRLPLRYDIPPTGVRNLVSVDWVSKAIVAITQTVTAEGVFHLTPQKATTDRVIDDVMRELWQIEGTRFVPGLSSEQYNTLEKFFYRSIHRVAPNWYAEPVYDTARLNDCIPGVPCPTIDHAALLRILEYAEANDWGQRTDTVDAAPRVTTVPFDSRQYLEEFLTTWAPQSTLPRLESVTATIGFAISGLGGGEWVCQLNRGDVESVTLGDAQSQRVCFATDTETFGEIVHGRLSTQHAFLTRRVEIQGEIETGLKLAMIFQQFVREFPFVQTSQREVDCAKVV